MKYYSEEETKELRISFEKHVLSWPKVSTKKMFGCPCYKVDGKLFAFLVTNGIVITQPSQTDRETLSHQHQTDFFQAGKKIVKGWSKIQINDLKKLDKIIPFVKRSYESAIRNK